MATTNDMKALGEKLEALGATLEGVASDVQEIKAGIAAQKPADPTPDKPRVETYGFEKPASRDMSPWLGRRMTAPDVAEALERARHGVSWAGTCLSDVLYEEAWAEVLFLQQAAPLDRRCAPYLGLQPAVVYFGLLTGRIALPSEYVFGTAGARNPQSLLGVETIDAYLAGIPSLSGRPGGPRLGGEE